MDLKHHNNFMTPNDNLMFLESVIFRKPENDTPTKQQRANSDTTKKPDFQKQTPQTTDIFQINTKNTTHTTT